jgi:hypothetical protein
LAQGIAEGRIGGLPRRIWVLWYQERHQLGRYHLVSGRGARAHRDDGGVSHCVELPQCGLHFPGLHPQASHLHLAVAAADQKQLAFSIEVAEVAGTVKPTPWSGCEGVR